MHRVSAKHSMKRPRAANARHASMRPFRYSSWADLRKMRAAAAVLALVCGFSIVPADSSLAATASAMPVVPTGGVDVQRIFVNSTIPAPVVSRDDLSSTDGVLGLAHVGTNQAWAQLVLVFGGWPQTDANISVLLQWMRQENGPPDWWNRNNPLNNGYGSGGGAGLGSYPDLLTAAEYCAENLQRGYPDIVAGLQSGNSAEATAQAIWASPWSTSHYGDGTHWSTTPVTVVQAPASAWGF